MSMPNPKREEIRRVMTGRSQYGGHLMGHETSCSRPIDETKTSGKFEKEKMQGIELRKKGRQFIMYQYSCGSVSTFVISIRLYLLPKCKVKSGLSSPCKSNSGQMHRRQAHETRAEYTGVDNLNAI